MQDSYSSIGGTVRATHLDSGYTQNELADKTDDDERSALITEKN